MRMNHRMNGSLGQLDPAEFANGEKLSNELSQLLATGFTNLDGAIVFTAMRSNAERVKPENFPDLTGFECFVNKIQIEDYLSASRLDQVVLLRQGIALALSTESRLRLTFPGKPFKVIVAATPHRCGVRFHSVRRGEEWLASDLDGYGEEAILVLET